MDLGKPKTTKFERKPSIKKTKAPPPVKQTLTSVKRILKATNPLLAAEFASGSIDFKRAAEFATMQIQPPNEVNPAEIHPQSNDNNLKRPQLVHQQTASNKPTVTKSKQNQAQEQKLEKVFIKRPIFTFTKPKPDLKCMREVKSKVGSFPKRSTINTDKQLRKSFSASHIQTKNPKVVLLNDSQSEENLYVPQEFNRMSPIEKEISSNGNKMLVFNTPLAYQRRSVCSDFTPASNRKSSMMIISTPAPAEMQRLQERLNQWLKSRGKPSATFHNLNKIIESSKKIDLPSTVVERIDEISEDENKENIEVNDQKSDSYEDLKIVLPDKDKPVPEDIAKIAKEATLELIKLIEEGYPAVYCLQWLDLIREKYDKIPNEPEYWELRAAADESQGNFANAVEHFKTAIVQGAKVETVDKSLDLLLEKFSLLNISPRKIEKKTNNDVQQRDKVVLEARNIFKSSIIQIAITERNTKKTQGLEQQKNRYIATPVRRSTRLSRSAYTNTSGVILCRSLREVNDPSQVSFENNKALI